MNYSETRPSFCAYCARLCHAVPRGNFSDIQSPEWNEVLDMLARLSRSRVALGLSPTETAIFIFSLKHPLFSRLNAVIGGETWLDVFLQGAELLDRLGLFTTEIHQKAREDVILRQQEEMLELSTPVVKLWDGILTLPLIGTLDSARTQVVMESLLQAIVDTGSDVAIIESPVCRPSIRSSRSTC